MSESEERKSANGWSVAMQERKGEKKSESWAAGQITHSLCQAKGKEFEFYPVHNEKFQGRSGRICCTF